MTDDDALIARVIAMADYLSPPSGAGTDHAISCECHKCEDADDLREAAARIAALTAELQHETWQADIEFKRAEALAKDAERCAKVCERLRAIAKTLLARATKAEAERDALRELLTPKQVELPPSKWDDDAAPVAAPTKARTPEHPSSEQQRPERTPAAR